MGIFKSRGEKELEHIVSELRSYLSNNYKDAAHDMRKRLLLRTHELYERGGISEKCRGKYLRLYEEFTEKMKDYHH